jgi:hypothetical protein
MGLDTTHDLRFGGARAFLTGMTAGSSSEVAALALPFPLMSLEPSSSSSSSMYAGFFLAAARAGFAGAAESASSSDSALTGAFFAGARFLTGGSSSDSFLTAFFASARFFARTGFVSSSASAFRADVDGTAVDLGFAGALFAAAALTGL